jgi:hypothetical protein
MKPQSLSSGRPRGTKLFPNRSGRVAYPLDCARQLVLGHAEMPRPIFNVIILLDNDFAAVRDDCVTDHGFYEPSYFRKRTRGRFVPPEGIRQITHWRRSAALMRGNFWVVSYKLKV